MVKLQIADNNNFHMDSLDDFVRFQTVTNVYRFRDGKLCLVHQPFTEDWSPERKREKPRRFSAGSISPSAPLSKVEYSAPLYWIRS